MRVNTSTNPEKIIAENIAKDITSALENDGKVLWLLAGGSALNIYNCIHEYFDESKKYSNLAVSLGDERWNTNPAHKDANWQKLKDCKIWGILKSQGAEIYSILKGKDQKSDTLDFHNFLKEKIEDGFKIFSIQGVGEDGHTSGILPNENKEEFEKTYLNGNYAVSHSFGKDYKERITISPELYKHIEQFYVYAVGKDKKDILNRFVSLANDNDFESLNLIPALYLNSKKTVLYTDQSLIFRFF